MIAYAFLLLLDAVGRLAPLLRSLLPALTEGSHHEPGKYICINSMALSSADVIAVAGPDIDKSSFLPLPPGTTSSSTSKSAAKVCKSTSRPSQSTPSPPTATGSSPHLWTLDSTKASTPSSSASANAASHASASSSCMDVSAKATMQSPAFSSGWPGSSSTSSMTIPYHVGCKSKPGPASKVTFSMTVRTFISDGSASGSKLKPCLDFEPAAFGLGLAAVVGCALAAGVVWRVTTGAAGAASSTFANRFCCSDFNSKSAAHASKADSN
mmetsp:Transcript_34973/g.80134  ORF Transcript_34973/g.80134 Transcript_34973/m.80134 type:complete len:268 (+) Transcript_34973:135-938(+)